MEYQEGYVDGLAGAGMQYRPESLDLFSMILTKEPIRSFEDYERGFILGSLDRKDMLKNNS